MSPKENAFILPNTMIYKFRLLDLSQYPIAIWYGCCLHRKKQCVVECISRMLRAPENICIDALYREVTKHQYLQQISRSQKIVYTRPLLDMVCHPEQLSLPPSHGRGRHHSRASFPLSSLNAICRHRIEYIDFTSTNP